MELIYSIGTDQEGLFCVGHHDLFGGSVIYRNNTIHEILYHIFADSHRGAPPPDEEMRVNIEFDDMRDYGFEPLDQEWRAAALKIYKHVQETARL